MDAFGVSQKLEMHRIFEGIAAEPIKAVIIECVYPTTGQCRPFERALYCDCALGVVLPLADAVATGISIGIDVNSNAKQVIGELPATNGVRGTQATYGFRMVGVFGVRAFSLDAFLHARKRWNDAPVEPNGVPKELSGRRHGCRAYAID